MGDVEHYWQPGKGARHVVLGNPHADAGQDVTAMCQEIVTVTCSCNPDDPTWRVPTCKLCDRAIRERLRAAGHNVIKVSDD